MAVDPKLINAAVLSQRAYNSAVASLAAAQKAIATITARGGTATAAQTAALTAAQNAVATSSTEVKSTQMAVNAATNSVAVAAGSTGKAVSPAVDSAVKQAKPYNVQTTTGTGPTMSSTNGLLNIAGAAALAMAVANPTGTAKLVGSLFSSAKDILGVGGTTSNTKVTPAADPSQFPAYDDNGNLMPGFAINEENGGTYYKGFNTATDKPVNPAADPSQFPAYDDNGNLMPGFAINEENGGTYYKGFDSVSQKTVPLSAAEQAMLDANDPPGYSQTSVPLSAAEQAMLDANEPVGRNNDLVNTSSDPNTNVGADTPRAERIGLVDAANDPNTNVGADTPRAERIGLVDAANDPNTNVGADTPRAERLSNVPLSAAEQAMLDANDPPGYSQTSVPLSAAEQAMLDANEPVGRNNDLVDTSSDPNTNVGADTPRAERIGLVDAASDPNTNVGTDTPRAERIGQVDAASDPNTNIGADTPRERPETGLLTLDDPYYGLTPAQLQDLGGADPTDPYIRARLGIPQLPGSELEATPGFGTIKTGIPLIDNALSFLGNLFGGKSTKPSVTQSGTTTGEPEPTPNTSEIAQDALKIKSEDTPLTDDEDQNLQNIVGAQGEIVRAEENIQSNNRQILANEESQAAAQEQQRQAQAIIDQNNAELADENLPDDRRAELEANNAAQRASIAENATVIDEAQTNIDNATANNERQTDSILTNQGVIAENSDAFTANSENLGAPVVANTDPATAVDQNFLDANAEVQSDTTLTILSEEETNALFDGAEPGLVDSFVESDLTITELTEEETAALFDGTETELIVTDLTDLAEPVDPDADPELLGDPEFQDGEITDLVEPVDPDADPELKELGDPDLQLTDLAEPVDPDAEPELEELGDPDLQLTDLAEPVDPDADPAPELLGGPQDDEELEQLSGPTDVDSESDPALGGAADDGTTGDIQNQIDADSKSAADQAAAKDNAITQATLQARYKQVATADWRVRLQLAPGANYLYKNESGNGAATGILAPLYATDGVIFPYTPSIETSYHASYETYDLTHSNFRGYFYKNSKVNDINIRAVFTAQDTQEANYLLAVIHFFRSVTKMFYGAKDPYRGAPPPLTYLSGFGQHQFNQHPCLVQSFNYSLPNEVDYIRAEAPNNYGESMLTQRSRTGPIAPNPGSPSLTRLFGTETKPPPGALKTPPAPGMVTSNVNNLLQATYVPTKIEISLVLLPVNTRSQVSQQFNMQGFASGALLKGGFW